MTASGAITTAALSRVPAASSKPGKQGADMGLQTPPFRLPSPTITALSSGQGGRAAGAQRHLWQEERGGDWCVWQGSWWGGDRP